MSDVELSSAHSLRLVTWTLVGLQVSRAVQIPPAMRIAAPRLISQGFLSGFQESAGKDKNNCLVAVISRTRDGNA